MICTVVCATYVHTHCMLNESVLSKNFEIRSYCCYALVISYPTKISIYFTFFADLKAHKT